MPATLTNFDLALKEAYEPYIADQLPTRVVLLQIIEKVEQQFSGRRVVIAARSGHNWGVGARGDASATNLLPPSQNTRYVQPVITAKYNYGRISVTGPTIAASRNDSGAFVSAIEAEIEGMIQAFSENINRQFWGDGTGRLCLVNSSANLSSDFVITCDTPGSRYIRVNQVVDFVSSTGATGPTTSNRTVRTVSSATQFSISTDITVTCSNNSLVVINGSLNNEMMGLLGIVDDSTVVNTFQGVARTPVGTQRFWRGQILSASGTAGTGGALTQDLMLRAFDTADELANGKIDWILCHHSVRREVVSMLQGDVRYAPMQLKGGFEVLTYAGGARPVPIVFDRHGTVNQSALTAGTDIGSMYFIDSSTLKLYVQHDIGWADEDGSILSRVANRDEFEAFIKMYGELACLQPGANTRLDDITVAGLSVQY